MTDTAGYPNKRARTQRAILGGAMAVMAEQGMGALTAGSISRAAGVSTATLYNHFDGVDAIADAVAALLAQVFELGTANLERLSGDPAARLALGTAQVLDLPRTDRTFALAFLAAMGERPAFRTGVRSVVGEQVARGIDAGVFDVPDQGVATDALMGAVMQPMRSMLRGELGDVREQVVQLVLRLLGVPPAEVQDVLDRAVRARTA